MTEGRPIRDLWWNDGDLNIVYDDDGSHVVYEKAIITSHEMTLPETESIKVEPVDGAA